MKRLVAGLGAAIALAIPAVVTAATPEWGQTFYSQKGSPVVAIGTYSRSVHGLAESRNATDSGPGPNVGSCNNQYQWIIGQKPHQAPIHITSGGYWSVTRVNLAPTGIQSYTGHVPKVTVTGHFTSPEGGVGTWQVHGCAKHSFKFLVAQGPAGSA